MIKQSLINWSITAAKPEPIVEWLCEKPVDKMEMEHNSA
jgi:hypothetical protein